jgi:hypothetical protein
VDYLAFLERVHAQLQPPTYLEIGIRYGASMALAQAPSIGIDPGYELRQQLRDDAALFRETSDDYFERPDPLEPLGGKPAALSFIDGMHLSEFALRDFINVERNSHWSSVVVFDDVLPRDADEAARNRVTKAWAGDIYKMIFILEKYRTDLICLRIGTGPTGLLLVLGLDPDNRVLSERYDEIAAEAVTPDPQELPYELRARFGVLDPEAVLTASFWETLRQARDAGLPRKQGIKKLRWALRRDFGWFSLGPMRGFVPSRGSQLEPVAGA